MSAEKQLKSVEESLKEIAVIPRKTLTELLNEVDASIYYTLKNSVYPGARDESIAMVVAACKTRGYPVLSKCYHIVSMSVKDAQTDKYEWRDVIMPGISLYRIESDRSKNFLGCSEPIFGPLIKETLGAKAMEYPEWCKITASKILENGERAHFTVIEYWKENYKTKGKDSLEPNDMWKKRPRAQLAKCTEAQALRRLCPDILGGNVTFEETEGKEIEIRGEVISKNLVPLSKISSGAVAEESRLIDKDELFILKTKIEEAQADETNICTLLKIDCIESMPANKWSAVIRKLDKQIEGKVKMQQERAQEAAQISAEVQNFFAEEGVNNGG